MIPEQVTTIEYDAFYYCDGLTKVKLPASLVQIGEGAFAGCRALTHVQYDGTMDDAFYLLIGSGNAWLTDAAWKYRFADPIQGMTDVLYLPASLRSVDSEAFCGIAAKAVVIPESVTMIESRAFADSIKLMYVQIPETVTSIADDAFAGSEHVTIICLEDGVVEKWAKQNELSCMTY